MSVHMLAHMSMHKSIHMSIHMPAHMSVRMSVQTTIHMSVRMPLHSWQRRRFFFKKTQRNRIRARAPPQHHPVLRLAWPKPCLYSYGPVQLWPCIIMPYIATTLQS